tara:strand:- start:3294 stop:4031 length:738 start_codon:yes stop_codon:yes gene_type:complete
MDYNNSSYMPKIFLTFDDGPGPKTLEVAQMLHELGVPSTFFMVGKNMEKMPEVVKKVAELGHAIGVHAYSHEQLGKLGPEQTMAEIKKAADLIEKLTGKKPTLFRAAYGALSANSLGVLKKLGLKHVDWSLDTLDWKRALKGGRIDAGNIVRRAKNGDVVLFHDGAVKEHAGNDGVRGRNLMVALPSLVRDLRSKGFEFQAIKKNIQWSHSLRHVARTQAKYGRARIEALRKRARSAIRRIRRGA